MTLLLGFAAVNTGNNLLFLIVAALLAFMAVSGVAGWQNIRGLGVTVELPDEIYADNETCVTVRIENRKRFIPSFLLDLSFRDATVSFFLVPRSGIEREVITVTFPRRGDHPLPRAVISSPFPVNFFVRWIGIPVTGSSLVFPRPLRGEPAGEEAARRTGGTATSRLKGYEGDLLRIGDYSGAEPTKMIHWRLSARGGGLKVKQLSGPVTEPVIIDPRQLPGDTEERLSRAAWLLNRLIRDRQVPTGLRLDDLTIPPATSRHHRLRLLAKLARLP